MKKTISKTEANQLLQMALRGVRQVNLSDYEIGECLHRIQEERAYLYAAGPQGKRLTFNDYIWSLPRAHGRLWAMIRIYRKYVLEIGCTKTQLRSMDSSKAAIMSRVVNKSNFETWARTSRACNCRELRDLVRKAAGDAVKPSLRAVYFYVENEDLGAVHAAIHVVQQRLGLERIGDALVAMAKDVLKRPGTAVAS